MNRLLLLFFVITICYCKKSSFITSSDALISITADTLHFDTVFTTTGSVTKTFKIKNENNRKLRLERVSLSGSNSHFKMNVNGAIGPTVNNIEIEANDSIYVFVAVSINPTSDNLPFIVRDSIQIAYNGTQQYVQVDAYGRNAHFMRAKQIIGNVTWTNDLPYVLLDSLVIKDGARLTIEEGCKIYVHANAPILVDGTLMVTGKKYDSTKVYFQGDRLDYPYNEYPASWPGIFFRTTSKDNMLTFAILQNGVQGVVVNDPSVNTQPKLTLSQCIIDNMSAAGIKGTNASISATNCLVSNTGGKEAGSVDLSYGGNYEFTHCTVANYSNSYVAHTNPSLFLSNYILKGDIKVTANLYASFRNCIFWGEQGVSDDEVVVNRSGATPFNVLFTACLWKVKNEPVGTIITSVINNQSPAFDSINTVKHYYNFRLKAGSPAIDKGIMTSNTIDLDGNPRTAGGLPDIGAYERPL